MEIQDIELRSEPVKEILSKPPRKLIRWGITAIFSVVVLLFLIAYLLKYPDVITARAVITTEELPASIVTKRDGHISHLFVKEQELVEKDQVLAVIDNAAHYEDWAKLKPNLLDFHQQLVQKDSVRKLNFSQQVKLGEMQGAFAQLYLAYKNYWNFIETNFYHQKVQQLRQKIITQHQLTQGLSEQKAILLTDFQLTKRQYEIDSLLHQKTVISKRDFETAQQNFLQEQYRLKSFDVEQINVSIQIRELQGQVLELQQKLKEEKLRFLEALKEASLRMQASLTRWEKNYLLQAPINGRVAFFHYWSDNQVVKTGDEVMIITPESQRVMAYAKVDQQGFGKVKVGQTVRIQLDGYPFHEYGSIKGHIKSISSISRDNSYFVRFELPQGLTTNYKKTLNFSQEMQGDAHIVTEELRLIERIFYEFRKYFKDWD
ncbi:MAG: HlyD family secretion protein [Flammeovirgaceae bacterium]